MGIASEMKQLTLGLARSHQERAEAVDQIQRDAKQLTGEAQNLIKGFGSSRKQANRDMRKDLARDKANLGKEVKGLLGDAQGLVKGFRASRRQGEARLRKELDQATVDRRSEVGGMLKDARQSLDEFQSQRRDGNARLREGLSRSRTASRTDVRDLLGGARTLLNDLTKDRQESGKKLRTDLAEGKMARETQVKEAQRGIRESRADLRGELKEARASWQELAGPAGTSQPARKPKSNGKRAEALLPDKEPPDLETKMLDAVCARPGGTTLTEIAESLGVVPIVLGRVSKSLVDQGKIRKEDKVYFPPASE